MGGFIGKPTVGYQNGQAHLLQEQIEALNKKLGLE
jgi:hypothetical protein